MIHHSLLKECDYFVGRDGFEYIYTQGKAYYALTHTFTQLSAHFDLNGEVQLVVRVKPNSSLEHQLALSILEGEDCSSPLLDLLTERGLVDKTIEQRENKFIAELKKIIKEWDWNSAHSTFCKELIDLLAKYGK